MSLCGAWLATRGRGPTPQSGDGRAHHAPRTFDGTASPRTRSHTDRPLRPTDNHRMFALSARAVRTSREADRPLSAGRQVLAAAAVAGWFAFATPVLAADPAVVVTEQARTELLAHAPQGIVAGSTVWLGLKIEHKPGWHTYWKNPGDSGLPTTLQFTLPAGFSAGEIVWPTPRPLPVGPLVNYGYEDTLLLRVPVQVPAAFQAPQLEVRLRADWLICKEVCIPEGGDFTLRVPTQAATSLHAALFEQSAMQVPRTLPEVRGSARVAGSALQVSVAGLPADWRGQALALMPAEGSVLDHAAKPATAWDASSGAWTAAVPLSPQRTGSPASLPVVLVRAGEAAGIALDVAVQGSWPALPAAPVVALPAASSAPSPVAVDGSLWGAVGLALLGGLLLNLMPCVFPVLSLKVLALARDSGTASQRLANGWAYTAGVIVSFLALAGLMLALRAGGEQLGWGFQLQSPLVIALLAALFMLIGLNLAGVFEVGHLLPSAWATAQARHPLADAALTGVLAVAVASPCTAPFMGASLGMAASLPAAQALAVFAALGLGMAAPYLAASAWPGLARRLPRPGPWMQHLRVFLAFPMFGTVVWLAWVLGHQAGIDAVAGLLGTLVALSLAAWAWGSTALGPTARRLFGAIGILGLSAALAWAWPGWTAAHTATSSADAPATTAAAGDWQPWSASRVQTALAEGRPVFIDFTAAWCVTCQFNKRTVLSDATLMADFAARRVVLLRADWTRRDAAIAAELARMQRQGVPVYALHAPGSATPRVLSELLTVAEVRDALRALP